MASISMASSILSTWISQTHSCVDAPALRRTRNRQQRERALYISSCQNKKRSLDTAWVAAGKLATGGEHHGVNPTSRPLKAVPDRGDVTGVEADSRRRPETAWCGRYGDGDRPSLATRRVCVARHRCQVGKPFPGIAGQPVILIQVNSIEKGRIWIRLLYIDISTKFYLISIHSKWLAFNSVRQEPK